jgi:hypothetical protein
MSVTVTIAHVDPQPAAGSPALPPARIVISRVAGIVIGRIAGKERSPEKREIAEAAMMEGKAVVEQKRVVPECEVVESVADEALAGERRANDAICAGNKRAVASNDAAAGDKSAASVADEALASLRRSPIPLRSRRCSREA